jgi:hypothetical protein
VLIQVLDSTGRGFGPVLADEDALDLVLLMVGAVARLRGYGSMS